MRVKGAGGVTWPDVADFVVQGLERLAAAAAILICGFLLALLARALLRNWLTRHETRLGPSFVRIVSSSVYYGLLILTLGMGLIVLGVPVTVVAAGILVVLVVFGLALHESIADLAATVNFLTFRPFKIGEMIETAGYLGAVQEILMYNTVLQLLDRRIVTLANSKIHEEGLVNYTRAGRLRVDVSFVVAYGQDLERVRALVTQVVGGDDRVLTDPPPEMWIDALDETGVHVVVGPTVQVSPSPTPQDYWEVCGDLREEIAVRLDADGIRFAVLPGCPYPNGGGEPAAATTPPN